LEAIVRISEAVAKFQLSPHVNEAHVDEAIRLFRVSTYNATRSGHVLGEGMMMNNMKKEVIAAQEELRRRLPVGSRLPERVIVDHLRNKVSLSFTLLITFL
jgi:DNA replication licensing factor MCM5